MYIMMFSEEKEEKKLLTLLFYNTSHIFWINIHKICTTFTINN